MAKGLNEIMEPILAEFQNSTEWQEITLKAYPPPAPVEKKKKKKDKGTGHPGKKAAAEEEKKVEDAVKDLSVE